MFKQSLEAAGQRGNLASAAVVERLVRDFYGRILMANTEEEVAASCNVIADAFAGLDPAYAPNPTYAGRAGMLQAFSKRLGVPFGGFEPESLRQGFARLGVEAFGIVKAGGKEADVDHLITWTVHLLLGTVDAVYPPGLSWKSKPVIGSTHLR